MPSVRLWQIEGNQGGHPKWLQCGGLATPVAGPKQRGEGSSHQTDRTIVFIHRTGNRLRAARHLHRGRVVARRFRGTRGESACLC